MKKILTITTLLLLSLTLLAACGEANLETPSAETIPVEATNPTVSEAASLKEEGYGAVGSFLNEEPTLEEMLVYAIQDEYLARSEYEYIISEMDGGTPFTNIIKSEETHIAMLVPLFEAYDIALPEDTSADHLIIPESLYEAYETGVIAEIDNIAMYNSFLLLELPDDIREAFTSLRDASEQHLAAFERQVNK